MFSDELYDDWDSTVYQDIFIKEYFGQKVLSKNKKKSQEASSSNNFPSIVKSKNRYNGSNSSVTSSSDQNAEKCSVSSELEFNKEKKRKLSGSSTQDHSQTVEKNDIDVEMKESQFAECQKSNKKKKSKNKKKDSLLEESLTSFDDELERTSDIEIDSKTETQQAHNIVNGKGNHISACNSKSIRKKRNLHSESDRGVKKMKKLSSSSLQDGCKKFEVDNTDSDIQQEVKNANCQKAKGKKKKKSKNKKNSLLDESFSSFDEEEEENANTDEVPATSIISSNSTTNKSSSFQSKIYQNLLAAKFRYLNEMLYKIPGQEALSYFKENTDEFEDYHVGYQSQVSKWPVNPVDVIIKEIRTMNKQDVIADLGCGEAKIAEAFPKRTVHSFDLVAVKDCVTACDIANVPLSSDTVDVAVFCLSLMGTNWKDYIKESRRILKTGAVLKIAEIESRIENVDLFIKNIESYGFSLENKNLSYKMFVFLNFKKTKRSKKSSKVANVTLKPCLYKKR